MTSIIQIWMSIPNNGDVTIIKEVLCDIYNEKTRADMGEVDAWD